MPSRSGKRNDPCGASDSVTVGPQETPPDVSVTLWSRLLKPLQRLIRRSAKLVWWTVTFRLSQKVRERSARRAASSTSMPVEMHHASAFPSFDACILDDAEQRLERFAPFSATQYFAMHGDTAHTGVRAAWHAVRYGGQEGRALFRDEAVARATGMLAGSSDTIMQTGSFPAIARTVPLGIYCNTQGDGFTTELARELFSILKASGVNVTLLDETSSRDDRPSVCLFVAPHEFFFLGRGHDWLREDIVTGSFMLNTEPAHVPGFSRAMPYLLMARGVVDIHAQTAQLLSAAGIEAFSARFGFLSSPEALQEEDRASPLFRVLPRAAQGIADNTLAWKDRPLDVSFLGSASPFRDRFFARHAARFAEYEAFLYCNRNRPPAVAKATNNGLSRIAAHVASHSKISLNIHRDEFGYFEWHRIVRFGLHTGSAVVSDTCLPYSGFVSGVNYFEENQRYIPDLIDWLLRSDEGRAAATQVRANNEELLRHAPTQEEILGPVANLLWGGHK